jgi:hypothetical protein
VTKVQFSLYIKREVRICVSHDGGEVLAFLVAYTKAWLFRILRKGMYIFRYNLLL